MVVTGEAREGLNLRGRLTIFVYDADGNEVDRREGDNVICATGYTAIAAALMWSGVQDQAANLGMTSPVYLTPLYGAIGTGTGTPSNADTQLYAELERTTVGAAGNTPATTSVSALCTWAFFYTNPVSTVTITEAGAFANATATANTGGMVDHWVFSPSLTVPPTNSFVLQVSLEAGP
jgi:hypothetical protein